MTTIDITKENFAEVITKNDLVILDFWAAWCGPCKAFAPIFEGAAEKYPDVVFGKVNTEEQQELAGHFQIRSIPYVIVFREQVMLFAQPGVLPAEGIASAIEQAKALDMNRIRAEIGEEEVQRKDDAGQE